MPSYYLMYGSPLLHFMIISSKAVGCKDIDPHAYTWMKRNGDETTVGCTNNEHTWKLRCMGSKWIGGLGNCTETKGA